MSLTPDDKQWISEQFAEERRWTEERIEAMETKLLTEFHKWSSPNEMRQRAHAAAIRALELEAETFDERLKKLEPPKHS